jgi:hypothetical protein
MRDWRKWRTQTSGRRVVRSERSSATRMVAGIDLGLILVWDVYQTIVGLLFSNVCGLLLSR